MSDFSQQIADFSPEQRALFEKRLKQRGLNSLKTPDKSKIEISKRKDHNELPLSFAQQRLWFFQQLNPDNSAYNVFNALRLEGLLNVALLEKVFTEIVRRHESLRTTFITNSEGQPIQVIARAQSITLSIVDLKEAPNREQEVQRLGTAEVQRSFDLAKPLLRITLLQLGETEYVLLLTMHHIISDRWSLGVFVREIKVLYETFSSEQPSPLPELPIQYADWAIWQRQYLQGEVLETQMAYWKQQLANLPILELPTDRPRPAVATYQGAKQSFELSKALSFALKALSTKERVTLFTLLLAAFKVLLYKYSNQNDIVVGTSIANRNRVETEGLIGFLVNTLMLRTNLSGNPTFRELLNQVREVTLGAYDHQDLSFDKLVDILNPERNLSQMAPLVPVHFDLQLVKVEQLELSDLSVSPLRFDNGTAKFEMRFNLLETDCGLTGLVEYSTNLFDTTTITRMVEHFQTLLEGIVANPQQRLSKLPLLTEPEQHQLLVEWNNTQTEYPQQQCIHQLFEVQVESTPNAVAVVFEDQQLTYSELNAKASQLAHYLKKHGVGPEVLVGICTERSLSMIIGLLGILKAGGAYVPLDPTYPQERLAFILKDTQVSVLLTQNKLLPRLPENDVHIVYLDTDWGVISQETEKNPDSSVTPLNLAYVIYTSGSTGKPKGVQIAHRNLVHSTTARITYYQEPVTSFLLLSSFAFDSSVAGIFWTLCSGGILCLAQEGLQLEIPKLVELIAQNHVSHLLSLPSLYAFLFQEAKPEQLISLRTVIVAGEPCPTELVQRHYQLHSETPLFNEYGPTEGTVWSSVYYSHSQQTRKQVSIGCPITNTQIYILDSHLRPVPIGVSGEVYISGDGLARGYLNQPALTSEKFIPNPFGDRPGIRLYKTGDLACYLSDGNIEFLGRLDHQVKIRGHRIELGEIEAAISQHPAIRETVVVARLDSADSQRIVAYVVPQKEQTLTMTELRDFLESKLPNYMVPVALVMLEALPLTPNGKVDRKALPAPDTARPELEAVYHPPQTEVEKAIANIWEESLHVEDVGIHDNFFDLGGHSLLLVQVHSKLQKIFQRDFPLVEMFQYPTISCLARYFGQESSEQQSFTQHSHRQESRTTSVQRRKQARQEHRAAQKGVSSQ